MSGETNLSFETVGGSPGLASGWTYTTQSSVFEYAFAIENFEAGWANTPVSFSYAPGDTTSALFTATPSNVAFDGFETWQSLLLEIDPSEGAAFHTDQATDTFELGWLEPYSATLSSSAGCLFSASPGTSETFEASDGWDASYATTLPSSTGALFTHALLTVEPFNDPYPPVKFVMSADKTKLVTELAPVLEPLDPIIMSTDGVLPTPFSPGYTLYVDSVTATDFKVREIPSGPAVVTGDYGHGTHYFVRDPSRNWIESLD